MRNVKVLFFGLLLSAGLARADSIQDTLMRAQACGNFVRWDDANVYTGFGPYQIGLEQPRTPIPGQVSVMPLNGGAPFQLDTLDSAIDSVSDQGSLYVLTYTGIEQWNLATRARVAVFPTTTMRGTLAYKQHAQAMARYKNKLILAHGRLGVSFFDLQSHQVTHTLRLQPQPAPREAMATAVTVQGRYAYVVLDNFTLGEGMFDGLILIDMESESVVATIPGLDPGADAVVSDAKSLIVSYSGRPIWRYDLSTITPATTQLPTPAKLVWKFPFRDSPTGRPAIDADHYYTCFWYPTTGGDYVSKPAVLDRAALGL